MASRRRLVGKKKSSCGQATILAAVLFLFLVPTTIIIAQNASSNLTGDMVANLSILNPTPEVEIPLVADNSTQEPPLNDTNPANDTESPLIPPMNDTSLLTNHTNETNLNITIPVIPANATMNQTTPPSNETVNRTVNKESNNQTGLNMTLPTTNQTANITQPDNTTEVTNQSLNDTGSNENILPQGKATEPQDQTESPSGLPDLEVSIRGSDRVLRGEDAIFSVDISNKGNGTALNVTGFWNLPGTADRPGFACGDLCPGESCSREVSLPTSIETVIGIKKIGAVVSYE